MPIIPKEAFEAVQAMMKTRTKTSTAPKKHIFTNILYCDECHKGMWYKANQKGYRCGGNIKHGTTFCLNKAPIREKELTHVILEDLEVLFDTLKDKNFMNTLVMKLDKKKQLIQKELLASQYELGKLKDKKLEYVNLYTENVISIEELTEYRGLTDEKIKSLQLQQARLEEKMQECKSEDFAFHIGNKLKEVLGLKELTPKILHSLVEKITCNQDGSVNIQYSFVNPLQVK
nr:recombinase zinc beta ribbon domain-containing protein [Halobacillus halophilus]